MPITVSLLVGNAVIAAGGSFALASAFATTAVGLLNVGFSVGLSLFVQALGPRPPGPEDVQNSFRQSTPRRLGHYGQTLVAGDWIHGETINGEFHKITYLGETLLDSALSWWVDDNQVTIDGSGKVLEAPYINAMEIQYRTGLATETAYASLVAASSIWTNDHRGDGIASIYQRQLAVHSKNISKTFPNTINTKTRVEAKWGALFNPKTSVTEYSDNAAIVIRDYFISRPGLEIPSSLVSTPLALAGWITALDICDEAITLKAGGTEPRYRLWGSYYWDERPIDVLRRMMVACDARPVITPDGGVTILIGTPDEPDVTLDETSVITILSVTRGKRLRETANTILATFTDVNANYIENDVDPWVNAANLASYGERTKQLPLPMSPSHGQSRRLAKIDDYRNNPDWILQVRFDLSAMEAFEERHIRFQYPRLGIDEIFEVKNFATDGANNIITSVIIDIQSMPPAARAWDASTEEGTAPVSTASDDNNAVPDVTGFTVSLAQQDFGGTLATVAVLGFDAAPSLSLKIEAQAKKVADTNWTAIAVSDEATEAFSGPLSFNEEYEFQVRHVTATGRVGTWTTPSLKLTSTGSGFSSAFSSAFG